MKYYNLDEVMGAMGIDKERLFFIAPQNYGKNQYEREKLKRLYNKVKGGKNERNGH